MRENSSFKRLNSKGTNLTPAVYYQKNRKERKEKKRGGTSSYC